MDDRQNNKSFIDHANDLINVGQNLYSGGRTLGQAERVAANVGKLVPILANPVSLAIIGIVTVTIIIIMVIPGGSGVQTSETKTATPSISPRQSNNISYWQSQIIDSVQPFNSRCGDENFYVNNVLLTTITNGSYTAARRSGSACGDELDTTYFCTNLVIDSYNLAGIKNNFTSNALAVRFMIPEWETISGGSVKKDNDVRGLLPGDAIFWLKREDAQSASHVSLISSMDFDAETGNGYLITNDANTNQKINTFYIRNFSLIGSWVGSNAGNIPWFGQTPR